MLTVPLDMFYQAVSMFFPSLGRPLTITDRVVSFYLLLELSNCKEINIKFTAKPHQIWSA
jgi:hypothetical protein